MPITASVEPRGTGAACGLEPLLFDQHFAAAYGASPVDHVRTRAWRWRARRCSIATCRSSSLPHSVGYASPATFRLSAFRRHFPEFRRARAGGKDDPIACRFLCAIVDISVLR